MKRMLFCTAMLFAAALIAAGGAATGDSPPGPPSAQALPIPAVADTDTLGGTGGSATLNVTYYEYLNATNEVFSLLRFDVASALPANAVIDSAVMSVYLWGIGNTTNELPVEVPAFLVRTPWNEYTVTPGNQPYLWSFFVSNWIDYPMGWKSWDITTWARNWLADPAQNYGVAIRGLRTFNYYLYFYSRESSHRPFLSVTYHTTPFCDTVSQIPKTECEALVDLYNGTGGSGWTNKTGWLATNTPCSWYGVTCSGGHVTELSLETNNLNGAMPGSLGNLASLQFLRLQENHLGGSIPSSLANLSNLQSLILSNNQLTGGIPTGLGNLSSLQWFMLDHNQLTGGIPSSLGGLSNVLWFYLDHNQLTGSIPSTLGNLSNVGWFTLDHNQLSGGIPSTLSGLSNIITIKLNDNQLTGSIPTSLGNDLSPSFAALDVSHNPLSGALPQSLKNLNLRWFYFNNTSLCEPPDAAFQAWLASIPYLQRTNVKCTTSTGTPTRTPTRTPTGLAPRRAFLPIIMKQRVAPGNTPTPTRTATRTRTPTRMPTPGDFIFSDNFNDGTLAGWTANKGIWANPGTYMRGRDTDPPAYEIRNVKSATGTNFIYEGTVNLVSGYTVGLTFRTAADGTLGYEVGLSTVDNQFKIGVLAPNYGRLADAPVTVQYGRAYRIKIVASGSLIEVYLDGVKKLTATDSTYSSGRFGAIVRGGNPVTYPGVANFDNLVARALP